MKDRKEVDPSGRGDENELGGVEEGKTIIRIHYVGKSILIKGNTFYTYNIHIYLLEEN